MYERIGVRYRLMVLPASGPESLRFPQQDGFRLRSLVLRWRPKVKPEAKGPKG